MEDLAGAPTGLLVAYDENLYQGICGWMRHLPANKNNYMTKPAPTTANHTKGTPATFHNDVSGLCGEITRIQRK